MDDILDIEAIDAFYGSSQILHHVTLRVPAGGSVCLLGRNGAGKTTTFRSIMNLGPRVRGTVRLRGKEITGTSAYRIARQRVAFVPEDRRIYAKLSVADNIRLGMHSARGVDPMTVDEVLDIFPLLKPLRERPGGQLSGGEQQMLTVARAIVSRPELLLLDEPTEGLAPIIVQSLVETLLRLRQTMHISLLLAEQNIHFALTFADLVFVIEEGEIVWSGDRDVFDADRSIREKYLAV